MIEGAAHERSFILKQAALVSAALHNCTEVKYYAQSLPGTEAFVSLIDTNLNGLSGQFYRVANS